MPWVNPSTVVAGQVLEATKWNEDVVSNLEFLAKPPTVRVERQATQNLSTGNWRSVHWDTEIWDNNNMWSTSAPNQVTIKTAGMYEVLFTGVFSIANSQQAGISLNNSSTTVRPNRGVGPIQGTPGITANLNVIQFRDIAYYSTNQTINIQVFTGAGASTEAIVNKSSAGAKTALVVRWLSS